jgi:hypothetical protein
MKYRTFYLDLYFLTACFDNSMGSLFYLRLRRSCKKKKTLALHNCELFQLKKQNNAASLLRDLGKSGESCNFILKCLYSFSCFKLISRLFIKQRPFTSLLNIILQLNYDCDSFFASVLKQVELSTNTAI